MRKEHYYFLVLVLAAAVVTGSTIGMVSNLNFIVNQTGWPDSTQLQDKEEIASAQVSDPAEIAAEQYQVEVMMVSSAEKESILEMLSILGLTDKNNYNAFIEEFQAKHSLNPTGKLDSKTLNLIINQATLKKASTFNS